MTEVLITMAIVVAVLSLLWSVGSILLRGIAWLFLGIMVLSLIAGIPVPTGVVVGTVACWVGGHLLYRARYGYWRIATVDWMLSRRHLSH